MQEGNTEARLSDETKGLLSTVKTCTMVKEILG